MTILRTAASFLRHLLVADVVVPIAVEANFHTLPVK